MRISGSTSKRRKWTPRHLAAVVLLTILLYTLVVGSVGLWVVKNRHQYAMREAVLTNIRIPGNWLRSLNAAPELLRMKIDAKAMGELRSAMRASKAIGGFLPTFRTDTTYVPIRIAHGDSAYKAKARLKGNWWDSRISDKMSLRIKLKGEASILGMNTFSIHAPLVKHYMTEWIYHRMLAWQDVMHLRYDFVEIDINGSRGIYAIEEHFDEQALDNNGRSPGVIVRHDETWMYRAEELGWRDPTVEEWEWVYSSSRVLPYSRNRTLRDSLLHRQFLQAKDMLEGFRRGELATHQVFDVQRLATLFALTDFMGDPHSTALRNMRFYMNPASFLLEPIGYDQHISLRAVKRLVGEGKAGEAEEEQRWHHRLFADSVFCRHYVESLERLSGEQYLETLLDSIRPEFRSRLNIIYKDHPYVANRYFATLLSNRDIIHRKLRPRRPIDAFAQLDRGQLRVHVANLHGLPLQVVGIQTGDNAIRIKGRWLPGKLTNAALQFEEFLFNDMDAVDLDSISVHFRMPGTLYSGTAEALPWLPYDHVTIGEAGVGAAATIDGFAWLDVDEDNMVVEIPSGSYVVDRPMILPRDFKLRIPGPAIIDLRAGAYIQTTGALYTGMEGRVEIHSSDSSGRGLAVLEAEDTSALAFTHFANMGQPRSGAWELSGMVTFYVSPVRMRNVEFRKSLCEDMLHIIRSGFDLGKVVFADARSDALDCDFSNGSIDAVLVQGAGNDGLDFSASDVELAYVDISGAGDKAISIGEGSVLQADLAMIRNCSLGVACKDLSKCQFRSILIADCDVGVAVFQKKSAYGPAHMEVDVFDVHQEVREKQLVETGSQLLIEGVRQSNKERNLKARFYPE